MHSEMKKYITHIINNTWKWDLSNEKREQLSAKGRTEIMSVKTNNKVEIIAFI
jgi:hypothetical protein